MDPPKTPEEGYHFTEDMTDKAISWVRQQKALMADKPFFMYFAPGAAHAPHHVPKEWADKYKGEFDQGWDKLREEILARQKSLGVIPQNAELTARPKEIQAWDELHPKMKPMLARQMEVFAGFMEYTDHHAGRLIDTLKDLQILDDTLIYLIIGDNGASDEGTPNGTFSELLVGNGFAALETPEFLIGQIDKFGTPEAYNHYAVGGACHGYPISVDQAGGVALGRDAQWDDRPLAPGHQGERRDPFAVLPRDRRRPNHTRSGRPAAADDRE